MFLKYSTGLIPPKKSRGKGSQGKKTTDVSQESVDVSDESEPKPAKKKTSSRSTRGVVIQDTPSAPKTKPAASMLKLKGIQTPTPAEQEAVDTMQARKPAKDSQVLKAQVKKLKKDNDGDADDEDEDDDHISDIQDTDDEDAETESDEDEIYKYKIQVHKDEDVDEEYVSGNT
ncbi:hypothetical protein Tco_0942492 [Tanacetum coccineum]